MVKYGKKIHEMCWKKTNKNGTQIWKVNESPTYLLVEECVNNTETGEP